ncbi:MAG: ribulose-phosphate 3-epimerase [Alphaproteobacteria bacterium]|nr:ribulose-phosphate 3-epimerase [Alphaproteobacteria bacterium]
MPDTRPSIVAASLLAADFACFADEVAAVEQAGVDWLHIDVMDGHFVPVMAITAPGIQALRPRTRLPLDVHLMIENPRTHISTFARAGADHLTIHLEADRHPHCTLAKIRAQGMKAGLALNPGTPLGMVTPLLGLFDLLLIMTVNPGFGGQKFLHDQVPKITEARAMIDQRFLNPEDRPLISIDGGINDSTAAICRTAGADVLGAGSAIFGAESIEYATRIAAIRGENV